MAVMIKDIEMPNSCFLCCFCRRQEYGEYVGEDTAWSCVASKKRITDGQDLIATFKHPGCPLVEAAEVTDAVSRQQAIEARRYTFGNDELSLEDAYHDCKLVFDGITDDDSFQEADTGLILYYANEIIYALQEALEGKDTNVPTNDCISRQKAIDALLELVEARRTWVSIEDARKEISGIDASMCAIHDLPSVQPMQLNTPNTLKALDCISRQAVLNYIVNMPSELTADGRRMIRPVILMEYIQNSLPSVQPTISGYDIRHLELIASVLQKENLPPERVTEALTDIGRIVAIIKEEFEEALRKSVEQCMT